MSKIIHPSLLWNECSCFLYCDCRRHHSLTWTILSLFCWWLFIWWYGMKWISKGFESLVHKFNSDAFTSDHSHAAVSTRINAKIALLWLESPFNPISFTLLKSINLAFLINTCSEFWCSVHDVNSRTNFYSLIIWTEEANLIMKNTV